MARTSRRYECSGETTRLPRKYMVGIYARISVDFIESKAVSIETQIKIIKEYIRKNNEAENGQPELVVYDIYIDSGKTGTNFEREGFERLMRDVRSGFVNCIIVKDFSRFGRNYIEADNYVQKIFPFFAGTVYCGE